MKLAGDDHLERAQSLDTLAAALARDGDFTAALERIDEAISLATTPAMVADFEARREAMLRASPGPSPDPHLPGRTTPAACGGRGS
jgi:hypothetical protein